MPRSPKVLGTAGNLKYRRAIPLPQTGKGSDLRALVLCGACFLVLRRSLLLFLVILVVSSWSHDQVRGQVDSEYFRLEGIVQEQNKYSIVVWSRKGEIPVKFGRETEVVLRLHRPKIDLENSLLTMALPISAADGVYEHNEKLEFELPNPVYLTARFAHQTQMDRVMAANVKRLVTFDLHARPPSRQAASAQLQIAGRLAPGPSPSQLRLVTDEDTYKIALGTRHARMLGFSILDLKPLVTDVFIAGQIENGLYYADEIEFAPVGDPLARENPQLPRCLFIGDTIAFNYQRPLREALRGQVNLHHPPVNCAGSSNWQDVFRWLGPYREPGRGWDVIAFNFGLWDDTLTKDKYQENLRKAIELMQPTGAELIWISSTPIDYGYWTDSPIGTVVPEEKRSALVREADSPVGRVPGRMRLQNQWAAEVIAEYPDIDTCDLWQLVKNGEDTVYRQWWFNKQIQFDYPESVPLARSLARHIVQALGRSDVEVNPMSVHSVEVPQLTDEP